MSNATEFEMRRRERRRRERLRKKRIRAAIIFIVLHSNYYCCRSCRFDEKR